MSESHNPHDALFKAILGDVEHARGAIRSIVPAALAEALDWQALVHRPGSFVDEKLREQHTDRLFSTTWRAGGEALIYFLFEHQSTPDPRMPLRLLRYLVRIWDTWWREHPDDDGLPVVIPLVLYHGQTRWSAAASFDDLFRIPAGLRPSIEPYLVRFTYVLDDLSRMSDEQLRERAMTASAKLVELCFKHARNQRELWQKLCEWVDLMRDVFNSPNGTWMLALIISYIFGVNDHIDHKALGAMLEREVGPKAKDNVMTVAEQLIQEGREQGIQQGREQGIQQGERALLLRQLRKRFGAQVEGVAEQRIAQASAEQVEQWAERVLTATSLAELFAG